MHTNPARIDRLTFLRTPTPTQSQHNSATPHRSRWWPFHTNTITTQHPTTPTPTQSQHNTPTPPHQHNHNTTPQHTHTNTITTQHPNTPTPTQSQSQSHPTTVFVLPTLTQSQTRIRQWMVDETASPHLRAAFFLGEMRCVAPYCALFLASFLLRFLEGKGLARSVRCFFVCFYTVRICAWFASFWE